MTTTRALVTATWSNAPHLTEAAKADLRASYLPSEVEAREFGIPLRSTGSVYPLNEHDYTCDPFVLPAHYARVSGLDVGWNWTACVWMAMDRENDVHYIYKEYVREQAPPDVHVSAIRSAGDWIPTVIDPSAKARSVVDGRN